MTQHICRTSLSATICELRYPFTPSGSRQLQPDYHCLAVFRTNWTRLPPPPSARECRLKARWPVLARAAVAVVMSTHSRSNLRARIHRTTTYPSIHLRTLNSTSLPPHTKHVIPRVIDPLISTPHPADHSAPESHTSLRLCICTTPEDWTSDNSSQIARCEKEPRPRPPPHFRDHLPSIPHSTKKNIQTKTPVPDRLTRRSRACAPPGRPITLHG